MYLPMKKVLLLLLALVCFAGICAFAGIEASGASEPTVVRKHVPFHRLPDDVMATDAPPNPNVEELAGVLTRAIASWPPAVIPHVSNAEVAHSVAEATYWMEAEDSCPIPMNRGAWRMTDSPGSRGLLALALAYFEGARFAEYVDDQRCNNPVMRQTPEVRELMRIGGPCDGGRAYTFWQMHIDGMLLSYDPKGVTALKLQDRAYAASIGLKMACRSLASSGSLVNYTGESRYWHPKADERLQFAQRAIASWVIDHP
jgi:hypothetical protein